MIFLILSILFSSILFIIFKLFGKYDIDILQAIVVNYIVATSCGLLSTTNTIPFLQLHNYDWFWGAVILGFIFITVFNLVALTTQKNGVSVAAVASKMSLAIPIIFGIIVYNESTDFLKIIGICIALIAVYLTSIKANQTTTTQKRTLLLPILVFIGSGIIDTGLKFLEIKYVSPEDTAIFSATIFLFAAIIGICILIIKQVQGSLHFKLKNVIAGICLGIPNYYSIYFLIQALRSHQDSAIIFTINNIAVLLVSTVIGILLFKEKLILKNWIGIALAIISIILVAAVS